MLSSRDISRNAVNWSMPPKDNMGLCCNSACKKCGTAVEPPQGVKGMLDKPADSGSRERELSWLSCN